MKKNPNSNSVPKTKPEKLDHADLVDQAPVLTKETHSNKKPQSARPQSVDVTHRFGKRSGST